MPELGQPKLKQSSKGNQARRRSPVRRSAEKLTRIAIASITADSKAMIARESGVHVQTVANLLNNPSPDFLLVRDAMRRKALIMGDRALDRIGDTIDETTAPQAAIVAGIMIQRASNELSPEHRAPGSVGVTFNQLNMSNGLLPVTTPKSDDIARSLHLMLQLQLSKATQPCIDVTQS